MSYKALPDGLFIKDSPIAGQGIFSNKYIEVGTELGTSHIVLDDGLYRTPLGGFINHSDDPNCDKYQVKNKWYVVVIKPIMPNEELFLNYTFYKV